MKPSTSDPCLWWVTFHEYPDAAGDIVPDELTIVQIVDGCHDEDDGVMYVILGSSGIFSENENLVEWVQPVQPPKDDTQSDTRTTCEFIEIRCLS